MRQTQSAPATPRDPPPGGPLGGLGGDAGDAAGAPGRRARLPRGHRLPPRQRAGIAEAGASVMARQPPAGRYIISSVNGSSTVLTSV